MRRPLAILTLFLLASGCGTPQEQVLSNPDIAATRPAEELCGGVGGLKASDQNGRYKELDGKMNGHLPSWLPEGFYLHAYIVGRAGVRSAEWTDSSCRRITLTIARSDNGVDWKLIDDFDCIERARPGQCLLYRTADLEVSTFDVLRADAEHVAKSVSR